MEKQRHRNAWQKEELARYVEGRIEEIESADIVVAIPSYNNAHTIAYVMHQISFGLNTYFPDKKAVIVNVDGGSEDGCTEVACAIRLPAEKIICKYEPYGGIFGKGSALRTAFEIAERLDVEAFAMVDADLRSINQEWIKLLLEPVYGDHTDYVTPYYMRYKYDGTITNFVTYPFTRALYGKRIRQPIGGEFGMSRRAFDAILAHPLWEMRETPQYGIDIFLTSVALGEGLNVSEALLGVKIHDAKDPSLHLAPMFRQVVGSMFNAMEHFEDAWLEVRESHPLHRHRGRIRFSNPEPINVNLLNMIDLFLEGRSKYRHLLKMILPIDIYRRVISVPDLVEEFTFTSELWVDVVYNLAGAYFKATDEHREAILDAFRLMWMGRVADFVIESSDLANREAEHIIEEQAVIFEEKKPLLVELYEDARRKKVAEKAVTEAKGQI